MAQTFESCNINCSYVNRNAHYVFSNVMDDLVMTADSLFGNEFVYINIGTLSI